MTGVGAATAKRRDHAVRVGDLLDPLMALRKSRRPSRAVGAISRTSAIPMYGRWAPISGARSMFALNQNVTKLLKVWITEGMRRAN
jgi:hypothetical protein